MKQAIDRDRRPGRSLLTGSANLLLVRQGSESLTGRASYLTLWPMTRREQLGLPRAGLLLHTGRAVEWLTPDVLAGPWRRVLQAVLNPRRGVGCGRDRRHRLAFRSEIDGFVHTPIFSTRVSTRGCR